MGAWLDGSIWNFAPDNTADTLYVRADEAVHFDHLFALMQLHFGKGNVLSDFTITAENIHTHCLGL